MHYLVRLQAVNEGGSMAVTDEGVTIREADAVTLLLSAGTDYQLSYPTYSGGEYEARANRLIMNAQKKPYRQIIKHHRDDFSELMRRVDFRISGEVADTLPTDRRILAFRKSHDDPRLVEMLFQYGRYLLVSSSRSGSLPANLQGIWANKIQTPWNGDYHTNINLQMNYWPVEVANLSECQEPLTRLVESLVEPAEKPLRFIIGPVGGVCTPLPMCSDTPLRASRPAGDYTWEPERGWFNTFGNTMPLRVTGNTCNRFIRSCRNRHNFISTGWLRIRSAAGWYPDRQAHPRTLFTPLTEVQDTSRWVLRTTSSSFATCSIICWMPRKFWGLKTI